jgi:hypothetical protein
MMTKETRQRVAVLHRLADTHLKECARLWATIEACALGMRAEWVGTAKGADPSAAVAEWKRQADEALAQHTAAGERARKAVAEAAYLLEEVLR